jgi:hypothetical protein
LKKQYIFLVITIMVFLLLSGCGGGVGGINPPNENYIITVRITPSQVIEGEEVFCSAEISPAPPSGVEIVWEQDPSSPPGSFSPPKGSTTHWISPQVEKSQSFSLIASFSLMGKIYSGSGVVLVLEKGSPPQSPPSLTISYPTSEQIVGSGTLLTILGSVSQGSNPLSKLVVLDSDGSVLQEWPIAQGAFRVDLERFGVTGRKTLKIRIVDSAGLYSEQQIVVNNDDALLDSSAKDFLRKYNVASDGGTVPFATMDIPVIVPDSLKQYWQTFQSACDFWNKYAPLLHLYPVSSTSSEYFIKIIDDTSQTSNYVAETFRTYGVHEVVKAYIHLYKGWLDEPDEMKKTIVAHEIGHGVLTMSHVDEFGPLFIMSSAGDAGGSERVIPPIIQRAITLLYSHPAGWQP